MGAVLHQRDEKNELIPIQWSSKKFTPTECRYGISEKEMYAVFWGIKKSEYELKGRKFRIIIDHRALEEIRKKPYLENNRINRWIEKIQEFDFIIEYEKAEKLIVPDALSRLHQNQDEEKIKAERIRKLKEGKWNKQVLREGKKDV